MSKLKCNFDINKLEFVIMPGNPRPGFAQRDLYDLAYQHYKSVWKRTFDRRAGLGVFDPYGFLRQSFVFLITYEGAIAAQLCGTFLDINSDITHDLSYFSNFKGRALEVMRQERVHNIMTLEFSSVNPKYSPRRIGGLCLGEVVSYLGYHYAMTQDIELTTGLPRRLSGTNEKVLRSGYRLVEEGRTRCGLTVDVVLGFRDEIIPHEDTTTHQIISQLWLKKVDLTEAKVVDHAAHQRGSFREEQCHSLN